MRVDLRRCEPEEYSKPIIDVEISPSAVSQEGTRSGYRQSAVLPRTMGDVTRVLVTVVQPVAPSRATPRSDRQVSPGNAAKTACNRQRTSLLALLGGGGCRLG